MTYGVFDTGRGPGASAARKTAARHNVPAFAIPTGPAVLVCANANARLQQSLTSLNIPTDVARRSAENFLIGTLVHEHMHAAIACAVDRDGRAAWHLLDPGTESLGRNLNEALAAWAQRFYFANDADMYDECTRYIENGTYPNWPYAGAETVETLYQDAGLPEIRSLVRLLRTDPEIAQRRFDELVASPS